MQPILDDLCRIEGVECFEHVPLGPLTTMKVGGRARLFLQPAEVAALERLLRFLQDRGIEFRILGNGSNLIVEDAGVGVVISLSRLKRIGLDGSGGVYVEAGCTLPRFLKWCVRHGYSGLEPLTGIPGSFGGAVYMNAGANGVSIGDFIEAVCITTARGSRWMEAGEDFFGYRTSSVSHGGLVSAVRLRLKTQDGSVGYLAGDGDSPTARALEPASAVMVRENIKTAMKKRLSTQPVGKASAGCIFKNPAGGCSAWSLIKSCGLQGVRIRDAQVSPKHANFIVNLGNASSSDVLGLIGLIKKRVYENTGVVLKEEVVVWRHEEGLR